MIVFFKQAQGSVPESVNFDLKLAMPVSFSDKLTGTEEVVVIDNLKDAEVVNRVSPTARLLIKVEGLYSTPATDLTKFLKLGINGVYISGDESLAIKTLTEAYAEKKDLSFFIRQEPVLATVNEQGLINIAGLKNDSIIGQSQALKETLQALATLSEFPTAEILILGEPGVGKSLFANVLAKNVNLPFTTVNVNTITDELFQSEMFGHMKGSFTGAIADKKGILQNKALVFMDEIGDISLKGQASLLSALQERIIKPVGSEKTQTFEGRFVFATNKDLKQLVNDKLVRQDFLSRISTFSVRIPSLRERPEDIKLLVAHELKLANKEFNQNKDITLDAVDLLSNMYWRDNNRQLKASIRYITSLSPEKTIGKDEVIKYQKLQGNYNVIDSPDMFRQVVPVEKFREMYPENEIHQNGFAYRKKGEMMVSKDNQLDPSKEHVAKFDKAKGLNLIVYSTNGSIRLLNNIDEIKWGVLKADQGATIPTVEFNSSHHKDGNRLAVTNIESVETTSVATVLEKDMIVMMRGETGVKFNAQEKLLLVNGEQVSLTEPFEKTFPGKGINVRIAKTDGATHDLKNVTEIAWQAKEEIPNIVFESPIHNNSLLVQLQQLSKIETVSIPQDKEEKFIQPVAEVKISDAQKVEAKIERIEKPLTIDVKQGNESSLQFNPNSFDFLSLNGQKVDLGQPTEFEYRKENGFQFGVQVEAVKEVGRERYSIYYNDVDRITLFKSESNQVTVGLESSTHGKGVILDPMDSSSKLITIKSSDKDASQRAEKFLESAKPLSTNIVNYERGLIKEMKEINKSQSEGKPSKLKISGPVRENEIRY